MKKRGGVERRGRLVINEMVCACLYAINHSYHTQTRLPIGGRVRPVVAVHAVACAAPQVAETGARRAAVAATDGARPGGQTAATAAIVHKTGGAARRAARRSQATQSATGTAGRTAAVRVVAVRRWPPNVLLLGLL